MTEGEEPPAKPAPPAASDVLTNVILFATAVIFFAFVSARLDTTITWTWFTVIIPWLVFEVTLCLHRLLGARQAVVDMKTQLQALRVYHTRIIQEAKDSLEMGDLEAAVRIHEAEEGIKSCDEELAILGMSKLYLATAFFWPMMRFTTAFLIAGRADNSFTGTWFLTAIPFIVGTVVFPCLERKRALGDPENAESGGRVWCTSTMSYGVALLIWLLGMAKMDNPTIYSGFAVWGPYFVLAGLLFCNMTLILCVNPDDLVQQQQQPPQDQQQQDRASAAQAGATGATAAKPEPIVMPNAPAQKQDETPNVIILT